MSEVVLWLLGTASLAVALVFAALAIHEITSPGAGSPLASEDVSGRGAGLPCSHPSRMSDHRRPAA